MNRLTALTLALCLLASACDTKQGQATSKPTKGQAGFDHSAFDGLLKKYVKDGRVDYKTWLAKDLKSLDAYLETVKAQDPEALSKDQKMTFWINVYNAWTIRSILKHYPLKSIMEITKGKLKGQPDFDVWKNNPLKIHGQDYHLDGMENKILRPMGDARIHFAVNCASIGCPPLRGEAYTADKLDAQLTDNGKVFFADPGKFKADVAAKSVQLSKIFDWYKDDFGTKHSEIQKALAPYAPSADIRKLMETGTAKVSFLDYDWNLNSQ